MAAAFVQATTGGGDGTSVVSTAFGSATTVDNKLVAWGSWDLNTVGVTSVTDSKGNTWTQRITPFTCTSGGTRRLTMYDAPITTGGTSHTVTLTLDGSTFDLQLNVHEVSGAGTFETSQQDAAETGTAVDCPSVTPASDGSYLVGCVRASATTDTYAPNTGSNLWVERSSVVGPPE